MPTSLIDSPRALDAAIAASRYARRETLVRAVRNQRIRTRIAFGLSGCIGLFALVTFFIAGGHAPLLSRHLPLPNEAAVVIAALACLSFAMTYVGGKAGMKKAVESLREMDQSM